MRPNAARPSAARAVSYRPPRSVRAALLSPLLAAARPRGASGGLQPRRRRRPARRSSAPSPSDERRRGEARLPLHRHQEHRPRGRRRRGRRRGGRGQRGLPRDRRASRPTAVVLVDKDDWQGAVAGVRARRQADRRADPALRRRRPARRSARTRSSGWSRRAPTSRRTPQVIRIGEDTARPEGFKTARDQGRRPLRARRRDRPLPSPPRKGKPSANVVVRLGERAECAMPAAAWAARSGDSVLLDQARLGARRRPARRCASTSKPQHLRCSGRMR